VPLGWGDRRKDEQRDPIVVLVETLGRDEGASSPAPEWDANHTRRLLGSDVPLFTRFIRESGGRSFGGGMLRFLSAESEPSVSRWGRSGWREDWPTLPPGVVFATDWCGRLYLFASGKKLRNGEPRVARFDPAAAEPAVLDANFGEFLGGVIPSHWRELLDADRLETWVAAGNPRPGPEECVVPKVPLFLGGSDAVESLELTSLVVAVSLAGQIWEQVKDLPPGTPVSSIKLS
jgi:hypothetical protein